MSVQTIRGSTADGTGGVQVAGSVYEGSAGPNVPWGVGVGNKETFASVARTGLTTADAPAGGDLTSAGFGTSLCDCSNCLNINVRATCSVASATLVGRVVFYDSSGNPLSITAPITFTSDPTLRLGNGTGDFVSSPQLVDVGSARQCKFLVDSISGTWAVYVRPC